MSEWILPHVPPKAFEAQRPVHRNLKPEFKVVDPLIDACFPVVRCLTGFLHLTTWLVRRILRSFPQHEPT